MLPVDLERIAGVVAVHRKGRDQHRAVHPNGVHRRHHIVARDLRRAGQDTGPGTAWMVAFIGMYLRIYYHHDVTSHEDGFFPAPSPMLCTYVDHDLHGAAMLPSLVPQRAVVGGVTRRALPAPRARTPRAL